MEHVETSTLIKASRINPLDHAETMLKVVVAGDHFVGKTSFLERAALNRFSRKVKPTIGLDFQVFMVGDTKIQAWDLSGQERFRQIVEEYFKHAAVVILCYSDDVYQSKEHIFTDWMPLVKKTSTQNVKCYIVKLKTDRSKEGGVTADKEDKQCEGYKHFEVSAKTNVGYDDLFRVVLKDNKDLMVQLGRLGHTQYSQCCVIH